MTRYAIFILWNTVIIKIIYFCFRIQWGGDSQELEFGYSIKTRDFFKSTNTNSIHEKKKIRARNFLYYICIDLLYDRDTERLSEI